MIFRIRHSTRFAYRKPASDSHNEIHLKPRVTSDQRCLSFELQVEPAGAIAAYIDFFGNSAHSVSISTPHQELVIATESIVERDPAVKQIRADVPFARFLVDDGVRGREHYEYLAASHYVPFSKRLRRFFWHGHPQDYEDVSDYVGRIISEVHRQFEYEPNATNVHSSLDDILKSGGGVCQDFAHLTIGMLRLAGVPARYVSGYLAPNASPVPQPQATHAWLEAWLPGAGWTGFDPTHECLADERYLQIAVGRDYGDVPPIRGLYRSADNNQTMTVELTVAPIDEPDVVNRSTSQNQQ